MVDAHRRFLDDCLKQIADSDEYENGTCHTHNTVMTFTGRVYAMVQECQSRGLPINVDR